MIYFFLVFVVLSWIRFRIIVFRFGGFGGCVIVIGVLFIFILVDYNFTLNIVSIIVGILIRIKYINGRF